MRFYVGTAGWSVPKQHLHLFPAASEARLSHLERYAATLPCMEVNSSFYKPHRASTWQRWAAVTPEDFRFAVKMPKAITHAAKLVNCGAALQIFFAEIAHLGHKLGPVLIQLPPKLTFDEGVTHEFLTTLRELHSGPVVLEARNATWFNATANRLLSDFEVARVAADPPKGSDLAATPGGSPTLQYWRFHGSPRTYYSDYDDTWQRSFLKRLQKHAAGAEEVWIVFDNTALGHAAANAVRLAAALGCASLQSPKGTIRRSSSASGKIEELSREPGEL